MPEQTLHRKLTITRDSFPLAEVFVISRGAKTTAETLRVQLTTSASIRDGNIQRYSGIGECVPYARYEETLPSVQEMIESARRAIETGCSRDDLMGLLPPGAARNALDCALWDLDAKLLGISAAEMAGFHRIAPVVTAYTLSAGNVEEMAKAAARHARKPVLKIKLKGDGDHERIAAVREAAPESVLIADANEAWREEQLEDLLAVCSDAGVALVEQPLPAGKDMALAHIARPVPVCADESAHTAGDLAGLRNRYDAVNIKLDKAGGLTAALAMAKQAQEQGFVIMIGSMVGSSLSMAPAMLLTPMAQWVDLDGPMLLAKDYEPKLSYDGCIIHPPQAQLWG